LYLVGCSVHNARTNDPADGDCSVIVDCILFLADTPDAQANGYVWLLAARKPGKTIDLDVD
jgi:hypothetical protein